MIDLETPLIRMATRSHSAQELRPGIPPLALAFSLSVLLAGFSLIPWVGENLRLAGSILSASAVLLLFGFLLRRQVARSGRILQYVVIAKPVHYVQLSMHTSIYLYWGYYWREVYHYAPLIAAQIVFVYALDMMLCWSRRDQWILGFGPFPIVLSTNLFLWFKDDWFFLQFLLISTGVLCKEFLTWKRDGRRTHIFNPSAIGLALFSVGLLATHSTHITWGEEVAVSLGRPPYIYLWIFAVGLVVQSLFSVTLVTLCAAGTLFLLNLAYTSYTGVYYFVDATIPIAVFLGLHLLITDPATSPRRSTGKALFGVIYGAAVFGLYSVLGWLGLPTFYDKLLCVPPLNLLVPVLERAGSAIDTWLARLHLSLQSWSPRRLNLAHMAVWISLFALMFGAGLVGGRHPGASSDFWDRSCREGRRNGCETWARIMTLACQHASGEACNKLGLAIEEGTRVPRDTAEAGRNFGRACDLKAPGACASLVGLVKQEGEGVFLNACRGGDGESCFILGSLHYAVKDYAQGAALFRQACDDGWQRGCGGLAECYKAGQGVAADAAQAVRYFERACRGGIAASCYSLSGMYRAMNDRAMAEQRLQRACDLSTRAVTANTAYFRAGGAESAPMFCAP